MGRSRKSNALAKVSEELGEEEEIEEKKVKKSGDIAKP